MSTFEVKAREITALVPHPNADRLELVQIGGYNAAVQRGIHQVGDTILYIPEDTLFEDLEVARALGIADYLTGKEKNRVKAIRLRGTLSQGIVLPKAALAKVVPNAPLVAGADYADLLRLTKYEEPIPIEMAGKVRPWPSFIPKYDVENIKRPESMAEMIPGEEVVLTEKLHGTNMAIGLDHDTSEVVVCSRGCALLESEGNVYWRAARDYGLIAQIRYLEAKLQVPVSLHGEVVGVQDLKYGHEGGKIGFYAFDIRANGEFLDYDVFAPMCKAAMIPTVPLMFRGPYDYETLKQLVEGRSALAEHIREGGVVRPIRERRDQRGDRVQYKFIAEQYLLRKGGSEHH